MKYVPTFDSQVYIHTNVLPKAKETRQQEHNRIKLKLLTSLLPQGSIEKAKYIGGDQKGR
jgi:hypothetical protein